MVNNEGLSNIKTSQDMTWDLLGVNDVNICCWHHKTYFFVKNTNYCASTRFAKVSAIGSDYEYGPYLFKILKTDKWHVECIVDKLYYEWNKKYLLGSPLINTINKFHKNNSIGNYCEFVVEDNYALVAADVQIVEKRIGMLFSSHHSLDNRTAYPKTTSREQTLFHRAQNIKNFIHMKKIVRFIIILTDVLKL